ncbi:MAG: hypothetical protein ACD_62C00636G0003 [uncultured bacterium]|nr:MAG: hypothetical protein ACD_62C00636G0003 [uncultured bacterium]HLD45377.1 hypothetical protein [bacterium]
MIMASAPELFFTRFMDFYHPRTSPQATDPFVDLSETMGHRVHAQIHGATNDTLALAQSVPFREHRFVVAQVRADSVHSKPNTRRYDRRHNLFAGFQPLSNGQLRLFALERLFADHIPLHGRECLSIPYLGESHTLHLRLPNVGSFYLRMTKGALLTTVAELEGITPGTPLFGPFEVSSIFSAPALFEGARFFGPPELLPHP